MLDKTKRIQWRYGMVCGAVFAFMLVLNGMSLLICDDFAYMFSFADGKRITNPFQIIPSMLEHRHTMNGRLVAHSFAQLMCMLPRWLFDIINAFMFTLQLYLMDRIASGGKRSSWAVFLAIFIALWIWCPVFGQVNLWTDGACNYLWSTVFAMGALYPFVQFYLSGKQIATKWGKVLFLAVAFAAGAYSETTSAAAFGVSVLLLLLAWMWQKRKIDPIWIWAAVLIFLGYVSIYSAPAQWAKGGERDLAGMISRAKDLVTSYITLFFIPLLAYMVLFAMNHFANTDHKITALSVVFFLGSMGALAILVFAKQVDDRIKYASFMYLLVADAILVYPLRETKICRTILIVGLVVLVLFGAVQIKLGVEDIAQVYQLMDANEQYIYECKEQGILEIYLDMVQPQTKYSIAYDMVYLRHNRIDMYPNPAMVKYYGIEKIVGILPGE